MLQRAVAMVLEAIYEEGFLSCSYGFRPGRSAHEALRDLWRELMGMGGGWVLEVDIRSFFDELDHGHLAGLGDLLEERFLASDRNRDGRLSPREWWGREEVFERLDRNDDSVLPRQEILSSSRR